MPDALLASIPRTVAPFFDAEARAVSVGGRHLPFYRSTGRLWYVLDTETMREVSLPPEYGPPKPWHVLVDEIAAAEGGGRRVYFISGGGAIKIGVSGSPKARLANLQTGSPVKLTIVAERNGGGLTEGAYHAWFSEHRSHGEWFTPAPEILAEIERLAHPNARIGGGAV